MFDKILGYLQVHVSYTHNTYNIVSEQALIINKAYGQRTYGNNGQYCP